MNDKDMERFFAFRQKVFDLIRRVDEGYHKSYEGAVELRLYFTNIYEAIDVRDIESVEIELHCYLLVSGRHITFEGGTLADALDKAEAWLAETEEAML